MNFKVKVKFGLRYSSLLRRKDSLNVTLLKPRLACCPFLIALSSFKNGILVQYCPGPNAGACSYIYTYFSQSLQLSSFYLIFFIFFAFFNHLQSAMGS